VLVVDVGGGTSDFSLIAILERRQAGTAPRGRGRPYPARRRQHGPGAGAPGRAQAAANGTQLDAWQMRALTYACRGAKEHLLADAECGGLADRRAEPRLEADRRLDPHRTDARLKSRPSSPTASSRAWKHRRPATRTRAGLTQLGLPYAQDAAVTRHLAAFLARQAGATAQLEGFDGQVNPEHSFLHPSAVLFNGGVFKSAILAQRVMDTINDWLYMEGAEAARMLEGADLDLAVARGAAYYGYARRGGGVRIRGGTARSYYVGIESSMPAIPGLEPPLQALCVAPFGMEEGSELPNCRARNSAWWSASRCTSASSVRPRGARTRSARADFWGPDELQELNEIQATLPAEGRSPGDVVQVKLHALATEIRHAGPGGGGA
jgi:hypothetical protein